MPAQLVKTSTPGIFKRGNRYVFSTASTVSIAGVGPHT